MTSKTPATGPVLARRTFLAMTATGTAGLLAACTGATPLVTYDLVAAATQPVARRSNRTVLISVPEAIQTYDTDRIVAREAGGVLSYLPTAQWSDSLPRLIQTRLLQAFQDAGVANVGRTTDPLNPDRVLASDIRAFELDLSAGRQAVVSLNVRLVDDWNRRIVASSAFAATVPAPGTTAPEAVPALNAALNQVIEEIVRWTVQRV